MNTIATFTTAKAALIASLTAAPSALRSTLLVLPLLLVTLACLPALAVLPFLPDGTQRATRIVNQLIRWTGALVNVT